MTENKNTPDFVSMEAYDRKYAYSVLGILVGLIVLVMYIEGMLTPSLPSIEVAFNITPAQASLILSMYMVGGVAITPIVGKLGDIYGKKRILTVMLSIYVVAVAITGFSPTFWVMIASRTVQGVGLSVMPLGFSLVREEFPKELVPKAQALISAMFGVGFAISIPLGSLISNDFGWRWTYHSAIPFLVVLVIVSFLVIKESRFRKPNVKIDYVGAALLSSVLSMFVMSLSEGSTWGWTSIYTLGLVGAGVIALVPLLLYELRYTRRGGEAIVNFRLLAMRNVFVANIILAIAGIGQFLAMQALTYRFIYGFNESIFHTGLSMVPFAIGIFVFGPITGSLVTKVGVKPLAIVGTLVSAAGFLMQGMLPGYNEMLAYEFITGAGLSMINGTLINFVVLTVNPREMGLATALNSTFRFLGSSIGAPIAGSLLATYSTLVQVPGPNGPEILTVPKEIAFTYIFVIAAIVFLAATILIPFGKEVLGKRGRSKASSVARIVAEAEPKGNA